MFIFIYQKKVMWYADGVVVAVVPRMYLPLSSTSVTGWPNCMCTCVGMLVVVEW